jgi:hypothetical protein
MFPADAAGFIIKVFPADAVGIKLKYCRVLHLLPLLQWEILHLHYTNPTAKCHKNISFRC